MRVMLGTLVGMFLTLSLSAPAEATLITLDPTRTFYHTDSTDTGPDSIPIDLASLGLASGDLVRLRMTGDFSYCGFCGFPEDFFGAGAVFVDDTTLLDRNEPHRVVGAIDAGVDVFTGLTFFEAEATDIPEDFGLFSSDVLIRIPVGATHLFVAPIDSYFGDNVDFDGDFALSISEVPEPSTLALVSLGFASLMARRRRQRR